MGRLARFIHFYTDEDDGNGGGGGSAILKTVTGAIIHITDALAKPAKEFVATFTPKQDGSGDPSPDNVRPITGWTGCNVYQRGANFIVPDNPSSPAANYSHTSSGTIKYSSEYGAFYSDGAGIGYASHSGTNQRFFIAPKDMTVTFSVDVYLVNTPYGIRFYKNGTRITDIKGTANQWDHYTYTTTMQQGDYLVLVCYDGIYWKNLQVVSGSTDLPYSEYQGNTLSISWQTEAGTVYGGTLTIHENGSADLTSMMQQYVATTSNSEVYGDSTYIRSNFSGSIVSDESNLCNKTKITIASQFNSGGAGFIRPGSSNTVMYWRLKPASQIDVEHDEAATWLDGSVVFVLRRSTPITYSFPDAEKLILFLGENNIWADASDSLSLTYYADGNVSDAEALNTLLGGMYTQGDVSDREALQIILGETT